METTHIYYSVIYYMNRPVSSFAFGYMPCRYKSRASLAYTTSETICICIQYINLNLSSQLQCTFECAQGCFNAVDTLWARQVIHLGDYTMS